MKEESKYEYCIELTPREYRNENAKAVVDTLFAFFGFAGLFFLLCIVTAIIAYNEKMCSIEENLIEYDIQDEKIAFITSVFEREDGVWMPE